MTCVPQPIRPPRVRFDLELAAFTLALSITCLIALFAAGAQAQDWSDESGDDWESLPEATPDSDPYGANYATAGSAATPWALRAGVGFIHDPNDFLMNFEVPYSFDQYVSAGPMLQVGLEDNRLLIAPTANLTVRVPDLPGTDFDRFHPNFFVGIGFAYIENDDRRNDNSSVGFLINTGVGLDYQLSPRVALGSRMILNFLPERTLEEEFFYSWEVIGVKLSF